MKITKAISIEKYIYDDIKCRNESYKFNFSDWIESKYTEEFFNYNIKKEKIAKLREQITILETEVKEIDRKNEQLTKVYSEQERRWLLKVPQMKKSGSTIDGLLNVFNKSFNRHMTEKSFKEMVVEVARNG